MEWWGLFEDGELIAVRRFFNQPSIFDFQVFFSNEYEYEIARVCIRRL